MNNTKRMEQHQETGRQNHIPDPQSPSLKVSLQFLPRDPLYATEKPYSIQYVPHGDVPQTNVYQDTVPNVPMRDMRGPLVDSLTLHDDGFAVRGLKSRMRHKDFAYPETVKSIYLPEVCELLKRETGTENVAILEYLVRRRHGEFPISPGTDFEYAQPVATAHIDFSPDCILEILEDRYAERLSEMVKHRYQVINVWKPLVGPLRDWPLCLCSPASIDQDRDLQLMDRVYPTNIEESIQIHYNPRQRWLYLNDQTTEEVIMFRSGDSELGMKGGVPHCSFKLPEDDGDDHTPPGTGTRQLRESVEVRALVSYANEDLDMARVSPSRRHGPKSTYLQQQGGQN